MLTSKWAMTLVNFEPAWPTDGRNESVVLMNLVVSACVGKAQNSVDRFFAGSSTECSR